MQVQPARFDSAENALAAMLAGRARVTLVSRRTGVRYTYEIDAVKGGGDAHFARLLTGSDSYTYLGTVRGRRVRVGGKSKFSPDAAPVVALDFALVKLGRNELPAGLEIWHEGRCCRCGRPLTVPDSIATGLGPVCAEKGA